MNKHKLTINCYGSFKRFGNSIDLKISSNLSVAELKQKLIDKLGTDEQKLIESSVIADEKQILKNHQSIHLKQKLSIFPPVCGG